MLDKFVADEYTNYSYQLHGGLMPRYFTGDFYHPPAFLLEGAKKPKNDLAIDDKKMDI